MIFMRALIHLALLVTLVGSVQGEEFWGRKLPVVCPLRSGPL